MAFSLGLAIFLIPKPQPNRANTYFFEPPPCILHCVCVFFYDVRVFEASEALRAAPRAPQGVPRGLPTLLGGPIGTSLGPCWAPRSPLGALLAPLAAPRALPGALLAVSWRSLGAFWSPGTSFSTLFSLRFVLAFCATATEIATASWSLALEALNQGSWALALESWALARGSLALARGSWALALGS